MPKSLLNPNWIQCPISGESLILHEGSFINEKVKYNKIQKLYYDFMILTEHVYKKPLAKIWTQLQMNGEESYKNAPKSNLGVGPRQDYINFAKFCNFHGNVLDVGCGPQYLPTHFEYSGNGDFNFIGTDVLVGDQPRGFVFIRAFGEKLPFKDKIFDQVIYVTSLDHFIDPVVALIEGKRVLNDSGSICIWVGEKALDCPKPATSPEWYKNLVVPDGADDPFHFKRFSIDELRSYISLSRLSVLEWEVQNVDTWRNNHFIKLSR